jgi:DNA helicase-2/ATP-dependent DNA helicase PcrA
MYQYKGDTMKISLQEELDLLNPAQREAVVASGGHLLVLAGAGSGKTRVIVYRIAWLIAEQHVPAHAILAVTFTNKAAGEMRERLLDLLGREIEGMWVGTFHGLSHKFLRLHWQEASLPESFQVIDGDDQLQSIRRLFKTMGINEDRFEPKKIQSYINRKKDEGVRANQLPPAENPYEKVQQEIYAEYEKICEKNGLVDFAELLLRCYELLKNNAELFNHYRARFSHLLVDEFQDTNSIQYQWLSLLASPTSSVTVVGDDDQSIYGWRGAKIENIRRFEREFKGTRMVRLEQNYRSTSTILAAANALISYNPSRFGKTLWTDGIAGEPISLYAGFNEEDEALYVVREIRRWLDKGRRFDEIGLLYRSNAQSRVLEESLVRSGIPYRIYGGLRFFERAEIKDALAYLRLVVNLDDNAAFERVINVPPRGIGDRSLEKIQELARECGVSYWHAAKEAMKRQLLTGKIESSLRGFIAIIQGLCDIVAEDSLSKIIQAVIHDSGLLRFFKEQEGEKAQNRAENLEELINAASDYELENPTQDELSPITAFLSYTSLEAGERKSGVEESAVQLMTLHSAKGLEFPLVFICGLEDGLFPHHFSRETPSALEEERRLCYVGVTRAREKLHLSYAEKRRIFGRDEERQPSRFIREIPENLIEETKRKVVVRASAFNQSAFGSQSSMTSMAMGVESEHGYRLGQRVLHPKFGEGNVLDHEGSGERTRIHVKFDNYGSKWLALAYAKLEPV